MSDLKPVHFGPVYGRPAGQSMALCAPKLGASNTMTRSATVTCRACIDLLINCNEPDAIAAIDAARRAGGAE